MFGVPGAPFHGTRAGPSGRYPAAMELLALGLALLALLLAWRAYSLASSQVRVIEVSADEARRRAQTVADEVDQALGIQRRMLARLAAGGTLDPQSVLDGQLWQEVHEAQARTLLDKTPELVLVDVRSPHETAAGILPGARLIPVDELPERAKELSKEDSILVYCAVGSRSAAACEYLAREGFERLYNLTGGFSAWTGPRVTPGT